MRRRAAAVVALLALTAVPLAACGDDDDDAAPTATTESTSSTVEVAEGLRPFPTDVAPLPGPGEGPADGEHAVYLQSVDAEAGTVTVDFIEFLTGDAANQAYQEETGSSEPVPDDYWIRNTDESTTTLDVDADAEVTIVSADEAGGVANVAASVDDLPGDFGSPEGPYWITVDGGTVVALHQQYVP